MAEQRHLLNAPITEAVIDIQVAPSQGATFAETESRLASLDIGYPIKLPLWNSQFGFVIRPADTKPPQASGGIPEKIGLRLQSADNRYIAAFKMDSFTLSRLAPYEDWDNLEKEARRLWQVYLAHFRVANVTRIATRYINNLRLPMDDGQSFAVFIDEAFLTLPENVPQKINAFMQQFQIVDSETGDAVRLSLAWDGRVDTVIIPGSSGPTGRIPIVLDIDVFRQQQFDVRDDSIWQHLNRMRNLKNRCFFSTLTEEAMKVYS